MKLLVVGSSPTSQIQLNSQFVSGYHAEIVLLDNGDIFLTDKGSTNGTTLNGAKLTPNVDVLVRRGDKIVFADMALDWGRVPDIKATSCKKIISIGTHSRNSVHLGGDKVSRFHATIKQGNDGKWTICDHSTNGTTLNGTRIPKDVEVKLKKGDVIKCAGVTVDNPVTGGGKVWAYVAAAVAAVAVIAAAVIFIPRMIGTSMTKIYKKNAPATLLVYTSYHYNITAGSLHIDGSVFDGWSKYSTEDAFSSMATGFFISEDGLIATTLQAARPWLFNNTKSPAPKSPAQVAEEVKRALVRKAITNPFYQTYVSQVKVEGVIDGIYIFPNGKFIDQLGHSAITCTEVVVSDNTEKDVAVLKAMLTGNKIPEGTSYIDIKSVPDKDAYKPGVELCTIGFPMADELQNVEKNKLQAEPNQGVMNLSNTNKYDFGHSAKATNGSSGSPVFDMNGNLIGIISSGFGNGFNFAVRAEYIGQLLNEQYK